MRVRWLVLSAMALMLVGGAASVVAAATSSRIPMAAGASATITDGSKIEKLTFISYTDNATGQFCTPPAAGNKYVVMQVTLQNLGATTIDVGFPWTFRGIDDFEYDVSFHSCLGTTLAGSTITPGGQKSGFVAFEIPKAEQVKWIQYQPDFGSTVSLFFDYVPTVVPASISASPQQVPFGQNTTTITFTGGSAGNSTVCVAINGGTEAPFAGGASGSQAFGFVNSGTYVFNLRAGSGCAGTILATTTVSKLTPNGTVNASAAANPATLSFATSTTNLIRSSIISFDSGDGSVVQLMISVNGSIPQLFAAAQYGTVTAPWVFSGAYSFTLVKGGVSVSTATVKTTPQISSPNGTTASGPSPNVPTNSGPVLLTFDTGTGQPAALCTQYGGLVSFSQNGAGNATVNIPGSIIYSLHIGDCSGALATPGTVTVG